MNEIKKILINSSAGLAIGCSGLVTGQPALLSTGISLAALGVMFAKQEKLSAQIVILQSNITQIQQNTTENSVGVSHKFDELALNLTQQTKQLEEQAKKLQTQKVRHDLFLSALYDLRNQQKVLETSIIRQEKQLVELNKKVLNSPQQIATQVSKPETIAPVKRVYIDGNNLNYAAKALDIDIDFKSFQTALSELGNQTSTQVSFNYYTGASSERNYKQKQVISQLKQLGYGITILPVMLKDDKSMKTVGDDVAIATSMMKEVKKDDQVILVTGDGDFIPVIQEIQQRGAKVTIISESNMINKQLRLIADQFVSLESLQAKIAVKTKLELI